MQWLKNGTQIGNLTIRRLVARGGMGEVYEAHERVLDRRVALKIFSPGSIEDTAKQGLVNRFLNEARTHAKVVHPNIATIYGIYAETELPFITMEFVEGISLKEYLAHQPLHPSIGLEIFSQVLEGVRAMLGAGVLHRDLKPANIVARPDGQIKIIDFGIAKDKESEVTHSGIIVGSLPYLAPELREGARADWQSECWSLGAMLFEIMMRRRLIKDAQSFDRLISDEDRAVLGSRLSQVIEKMMATERTQRYASVESVLGEVHRLKSQYTPASSEARLQFQNTVTELYQRNLAKIDQASPPAQSVPHPSRRSSSHAARPPKARPESGQKRLVQTIVARTHKHLRQRGSNPRFIGMTLLAVAVLFVTTVFLRGPTDEDTPPMDLHGLQFDTSKGQQRFVQGVSSISFTWNLEFPPRLFQLDISDTDTFDQVPIRENLVGRHLEITEPLPEGKYYWRLFRRSLTAAPLGLKTGEFTLLSAQAIQIGQNKMNDLYWTDTGFARVDLTWHCKFGLDSYLIEIAKDSAFRRVAQSKNTRSCVGDSFQVPLGTWYWRVRSSVAMSGLDFVSAVDSFQVLQRKASVARPEAPQLQNPTANLLLRRKSGRNPASPSQLENTAKLRWTSIEGVKNYKVEISRHNDMAPPIKSVRTRGPELKWSVQTPGMVYWRVRAIASDGTESDPSITGQLRALSPAPVLRSETELRLGSNGAFWRWAPAPAAKYYKLQIQRTADETAPREILVAQPTFRFAEPGAYSVRVAVVSKDGELLSEFSELAEVRVLPQTEKPQHRVPAPVVKVKPITKKQMPQLKTPKNGAIAPSRSGQVSILFKWAAIPDVSSVLEIASDKSFSQSRRYSTQENEMLVEKISHTGEIFWRVCPVDLEKFACSETWTIESPP